jgi:prepilin-type N-terminal cleavage/methylation domain-containing protein
LNYTLIGGVHQPRNSISDSAEFMNQMGRPVDNHRGFTLVELVIVVLILGMLAAVAAPRVLSNSETAADNGLRQTLSVMRDAIDLFSVNNDGTWPGASDGTEATLKSDLAPYLRGPFPTTPLGPAAGDNSVDMKSDGVPLSGQDNPTRGWRYDYTTGEFIINYNGISSDTRVNAI